MTSLSGISTLAAPGAGLVSFLSPCVLPLVPGYGSYIAGEATNQTARQAPARQPRVSALSICFMLGFTTVFVILGASATALGELLLKYRQEENLFGGTIVILFGLLIMGMVRAPWLQRDFRSRPSLEARPDQTAGAGSGRTAE